MSNHSAIRITDRNGAARLLSALALMFVAEHAAAQASGSAPRFSITPALTVSETVTDSRRNSQGGYSAEAITSVTPSVSILSRAGRIQGRVDYALTGVMYARDTDSNELQNRLSASLNSELIQDHFYISATGSIGRRSISAFGELSSDPTIGALNYSQVQSYSISPTLTATPGGVVDLRASATIAVTGSGTSSISDSKSGSASLYIGSAARSGSQLGWSLEATRRIVDFDRGRRSEDDRAVAGLRYAFDSDLQIDVRGGVEEGNVVSLAKQRTSTWGAGVTWTPSNRTRLSLTGDKRSFGNSHAFNFQHRLRRFVWRLSDTEDLSTNSSVGGAAVPAYDLFFALFASQEPDPALRDDLVRSFLARNGLSPTEQFNGGFLTGEVAVQQRRSMSLAYEGTRSTLLAGAYVTNTRRAFELLPGAGDLATGGVRQRGLTFSASHKLSRTGSANVVVDISRSESDGSGRYSRMNTLAANWLERLSQRSTLTVGLRRSDFANDTDSNLEHAVLANWRMTF